MVIQRWGVCNYIECDIPSYNLVKVGTIVLTPLANIEKSCEGKTGKKKDSTYT